MPLSSSKPAPRRPNPAPSSKSVASKNPPPEKKIPTRRSRSVSAAASRSAVPEFSNKRDNPLYGCSSPSPSPPDFETGRASIASLARRSFDVRSDGILSTMDARQRQRPRPRPRSVCGELSRNSESEVENGYKSASSLRSELVGGDRKKIGDLDETRSLRKWTEQHPVTEFWDASSARNWEDRVSISSFSEAEETMTRLSDRPSCDDEAGGIYETVRLEVQRAVSEIRHDLENEIWRKSPAIITPENTMEILPGKTSQLGSDITAEYAAKLEQSQERARKLRADLAVEEQRGHELTRILKQMVADPKNSSTTKPRSRRKASIERLKMSRRLAEEAMNYFDECVSISTFDSSDFSSVEETAAGHPALASSRSSPIEVSASCVTASLHNEEEEVDNQTPFPFSSAETDLAVSGSCSDSKVAKLMHLAGGNDDIVDSETPRSRNHQFSFAQQEHMGAAGVQGLRHYIQSFKKDNLEEKAERAKVASSYDVHDYNFNMSDERLLSDVVINRNMIVAGGLLVCNVRTF